MPYASPRLMMFAMAAVVSLVVVPFLFWRGTWFGRPLTDTQLEQYLSDESRPRHIQHALVQISQRLERRDASAERWYPRVADLSRHPVTELRITAAWVMGQDNRSNLFHKALTGLLQDTDPVVRRNAALSLARFGDPAGRSELRAMLQPFTVRSPRDGTLRYRLKVGDVVNNGTLVARLETGEKEPFEIRSPLPGKLQQKIAVDGAQVRQGDEIFGLDPSADHVWEALRALYLIGTAEDLPDIERFTNPPRDWPSKIGEQAQLTARGIRNRS